MAYERKTWINKNSDGSIPSNAIPFSAKNLNNIEDGIEEALAKANSLEISLKEYADTNILYFYGTGFSSEGKWVNFFQLPEEIEFSKYIPIIQCDRLTNYSRLMVSPYDSIVDIYHEGFNSIKIKISSEGMVSYYDNGKDGIAIVIHIILVPVQQSKLTPIA